MKEKIKKDFSKNVGKFGFDKDWEELVAIQYLLTMGILFLPKENKFIDLTFNTKGHI